MREESSRSSLGAAWVNSGHLGGGACVPRLSQAGVSERHRGAGARLGVAVVTDQQRRERSVIREARPMQPSVHVGEFHAEAAHIDAIQM